MTKLSPKDLEAVKQYLEALADVLESKRKVCLVCGAAVRHYEQVGRCVYARPCGHRQYQGKALR